MPPYEITEHTADLGLKVTGKTLAQVLADAGEGLFAVIAPGAKEAPAGGEPGRVNFSLDADSPEELLHGWLDTLNVRHQLIDALFTGFEITLEGNRLRATAQAIPFDPRRQEPGVEVKAVTWHDLYLRKTGEGYEGFVLLDI